MRVAIQTRRIYITRKTIDIKFGITSKHLDVSINKKILDQIANISRERELRIVEGNSLAWFGKNRNMTMRKIEVRAHNTRTQFVRSEMEPHWKVARPCLQTVKSWARGTGRGESRGVQKPAGFYGLRTAVYRSLSRSSPTRHTEKPFAPTVHRCQFQIIIPLPVVRPKLLAANDIARS